MDVAASLRGGPREGREMEYYAFVHRDRDDGPWGAVFPDLPGCTAVADTLDELRATAAEALALHAESLREDGLPAPTPQPLEAVWRTEDAKGAILALPVLLKAPPGRVVRVNITIDESLLAEIDRAAGGYGRSGFLARGARVLLAARVAARDTPGAGRKGHRALDLGPEGE